MFRVLGVWGFGCLWLCPCVCFCVCVCVLSVYLGGWAGVQLGRAEGRGGQPPDPQKMTNKTAKKKGETIAKNSENAQTTETGKNSEQKRAKRWRQKKRQNKNGEKKKTENTDEKYAHHRNMGDVCVIHKQLISVHITCHRHFIHLPFFSYTPETADCRGHSSIYAFPKPPFPKPLAGKQLSVPVIITSAILAQDGNAHERRRRSACGRRAA